MAFMADKATMNGKMFLRFVGSCCTCKFDGLEVAGFPDAQETYLPEPCCAEHSKAEA